jgi:hypothetical protein
LLVTFLKNSSCPSERREKFQLKQKAREKIKDDCRFWQHQNYTETTKNIKEKGKEGA